MNVPYTEAVGFTNVILLNFLYSFGGLATLTTTCSPALRSGATSSPVYSVRSVAITALYLVPTTLGFFLPHRILSSPRVTSLVHLCP